MDFHKRVAECQFDASDFLFVYVVIFLFDLIDRMKPGVPADQLGQPHQKGEEACKVRPDKA